MYINSSDYHYLTDTVKSNKIAISFTVKETGTYTIENKAMEYRYPHLQFGCIGRSHILKYGFNFPIKIFEVDKNNLMKANFLLYEQKNIIPNIGVTTTLDPNK